MIELQLLRYVRAAAETGSFSRAADLFGVKQATLSSSVQHLESRLGLSLFTRSTRGVSPTDSGHRFVQRAGDILDDVEQLLRDSRALARGEAGVLRIGFHATLAGGDLAASLQAFREGYPDVEIEASERNRSDLLRAVDRGHLDIVIAADQASDDALRSLCLWSEPLIAALPFDHPAAASERLHWSDLRGAHFVVAADDPGPDIRAMIDARLSAPGHKPKIATQGVSRESLLSFVGGRSIAIGTGFLVRRGPRAPMLHRIHDVSSPSAIEQRLIWRRDNDSPTLRCFLAMMAERYGQAFEE